VTDGAQRRQHREPLPEALHTPALVIDGDQEPWTAQPVDLRHQLLQLPRIGVIAGEQDHAAHQRMSQELTIFRAQPGAGDVDHQWTQSHGMASFRLSVDARGGASRARRDRNCGNLSGCKSKRPLKACGHRTKDCKSDAERRASTGTHYPRRDAQTAGVRN